MPRSQVLCVSLLLSLTACEGKGEPSGRTGASATSASVDAPTLPPPSSSAVRVTIHEGTVTVGKVKIGRPMDPKVAKGSETFASKMAAAFVAAKARGATTMELAVPADATRKQWGIALGLAKLKAMERTTVVLPDKSVSFTHDGEMTARTAVELVRSSDEVSLLRWTEKEEAGGPVPMGDDLAEAVKKICGANKPCAERVVVRPGKTVTMGQLVQLLEQAEAIKKLTGASGLPVVRIGLPAKYQNPIKSVRPSPSGGVSPPR